LELALVVEAVAVVALEVTGNGGDEDEDECALLVLLEEVESLVLGRWIFGRLVVDELGSTGTAAGDGVGCVGAPTAMVSSAL
jgi:hypothetical protein